MLIAFLFFHENICCGYSLEVPRRGTSNEYPQHMFSWRNKKSIMWIPPLICSYAAIFQQMPDQPSQLCSLIRAFTGHLKQSCKLEYYCSDIGEYCQEVGYERVQACQCPLKSKHEAIFTNISAITLF